MILVQLTRLEGLPVHNLSYGYLHKTVLRCIMWDGMGWDILANEGV